LRLTPGLEDEVIEYFPHAAPPYTMFIAATSLSACNTTIPVVFHGASAIKVSIISDCGVIGYPK
jgi:fructose/tagatose bisphosphate aldolase